MLDWWNELTTAYQIFYGIGIVASLILIIQLVLSLLGADGDMDAGDAGGVGDVGHGLDAAGADALGDGLDAGAAGIEHASGLHIISIRTVVAFMAGFGWTGAVALRSGLPLLPAVLVAVAVGAVLMWLVFSLMRFLYSMRQSGTLDYRNAVGAIGTVYIPIPPARSGEGQIQVSVQGRLQTVQACTSGQARIASGTQVKVVGLVTPRVLLVESIAAASGAPAEK